jgi:hypothetical protein
MWARTEWLDYYVEDGEAVVMLPSGEVVAVSPLAWTALDALGNSRLSTSSIAEQLVARLGAPGGALSPEQVTAETLSALERAGLVAQIR